MGWIGLCIQSSPLQKIICLLLRASRAHGGLKVECLVSRMEGGEFGANLQRPDLRIAGALQEQVAASCGGGVEPACHSPNARSVAVEPVLDWTVSDSHTLPVESKSRRRIWHD